MTFAEIITQVGQRLNHPTSGVSTDTRTRMLAYLNARHRQILSKVAKLRDSNYPLTTVSGQQQYSLPPSIERVKDIYDPRTNNRKLVERTESYVRATNPRGEVQSFGPPSGWADMGIVAWQNKMATANTLYVVSASNTDVGNATIQYIRTGGYPATVTTTLTGNTPVQMGTHSDIIEITSFYLQTGAANGFVTLHSANGTGTTISTLGPGQTNARFKSILLDPTPNSNTLVLQIDCVRNIPDALANPYEEPLLPLDFHWVLIEGVLMDELFKLDDSRYLATKDEYEKGIRDLQSEMLNNDDLVIVPGGQRPVFYPFAIPATGNPSGN